MGSEFQGLAPTCTPNAFQNQRWILNRAHAKTQIGNFRDQRKPIWKNIEFQDQSLILVCDSQEPATTPTNKYDI